MTTQMFKQWILDKYNLDVCHETARLYLHRLGFTQPDHKKGVFFDGHERDDDVLYRNEYLDILEELGSKSISPYLPPPIAEGEKPLVRVVHDESAFYSNADQTTFWSDGHILCLRQKSLGSSIMVSDFVVEGYGYLRDDVGEARLLLETQRDGYYNSSMFTHQVDTAIDIFDRIFQNSIAIFMFDNAPSHRKYPSDGLNASDMNVHPGGKQPKMRDTVWNSSNQSMVLADGTPKGMKLVLQERGVDTRGLSAEKMREILSNHEDFKTQKTIIEEQIQSRGHICVFFPKFHCKLNPIEHNWCHAKKEARKYVNGSIVRLREVVPKSLDCVTNDLMNKFFRTCRDYKKAYRAGHTCSDVEAAVKLCKSHRRVFSTNS